MADWTYPTDSIISGATKIKDADNKLQAAMTDFNNWVNGTGTHVGVGFKDDAYTYIDGLFQTFSENTVDVEW